MNAIRYLNGAITTRSDAKRKSDKEELMLQSRSIPRTSEERQKSSLTDQPVTIRQLCDKAAHPQSLPKTFLYLAYGSNLCAETFLVKRQIRPLSQVNVVVPEICLTFDLAGIPYTEPCFGNCRYRTQDTTPESVENDDYHKDRWTKGLVGVVYEVTAADYAHIIATEGGGSGYKDVLVDCHELDQDPTQKVPLVPTTAAFKAHTLFSPPSNRSRTDLSYAQPSARYKKLITDGALEHELPIEYREFLDDLRIYRITTVRQRMGQTLYAAFWMPIIGLLFVYGGKIFLRKDGTYPPWYARLVTAMFLLAWTSYDKFFKPAFGDGERTIGDDADKPNEEHAVQEKMLNEKTPLLQTSGISADVNNMV